jgi:hypothetical protein
LRIVDDRSTIIEAAGAATPEPPNPQQKEAAMDHNEITTRLTALANAASAVEVFATSMLQRHGGELDGDRLDIAAAAAQEALAELAALRAAMSPDAGVAHIYSRRRELNARGRGTEEFRLAVTDAGTVWLDQAPGVVIVRDGWTGRGMRASERRCSTICAVPVGTLIIDIQKHVGYGRARPDYALGITIADDDGIAWEPDARCPWVHEGIKAGNVHVLKNKATGERREVSPV